MKQSSFNNQYKNVSNNIALNATRYNSTIREYYTTCQGQVSYSSLYKATNRCGTCSTTYYYGKTIGSGSTYGLAVGNYIYHKGSIVDDGSTNKYRIYRCNRIY